MRSNAHGPPSRRRLRFALKRAYWLVITAAGLDHSGYYDDRFLKTDGAWLIAYRRPRTLWISLDSLLAKRDG
jgi:hypothetical protein